MTQYNQTSVNIAVTGAHLSLSGVERSLAKAQSRPSPLDAKGVSQLRTVKGALDGPWGAIAATDKVTYSLGASTPGWQHDRVYGAAALARHAREHIDHTHRYRDADQVRLALEDIRTSQWLLATVQHQRDDHTLKMNVGSTITRPYATHRHPDVLLPYDSRTDHGYSMPPRPPYDTGAVPPTSPGDGGWY